MAGTCLGASAMIAAGIDLGGTKIETQIFDAQWQLVDKRRVATPDDYDTLVQEIAAQIAWVDARVGGQVPLGLCMPGLLDPHTDLAVTANLCAMGRPLSVDVNRAAGRGIPVINDCRALGLSEAIFGVGRGHSKVLSIILGTGIGGGLVVDGTVYTGPTTLAGEVGHMSAAAALICAHNLPVITCGCGHKGCVETYIAAAGLSALAQHFTGTAYTPQQIAALRLSDPDVAKVWEVWCAITAEMLRDLSLAIDPDIIVLGGGLSNINGVAQDLSQALTAIQLGGFGAAPIRCAAGGDASGARGAAYFATQGGGV